MIGGMTRRGKVAGWVALVGALGAVAGVVVNGYVSAREIEERGRRDAFVQAQLERSWEILQGAVAGLRTDAKERDRDLDRLREAVAEMKGVFTHFHRGRPQGRLEGGAVERLLGAPRAGRAKGQPLELPAELPVPEPKRVKEHLQQMTE